MSLSTTSLHLLDLSRDGDKEIYWLLPASLSPCCQSGCLKWVGGIQTALKALFREGAESVLLGRAKDSMTSFILRHINTNFTLAECLRFLIHVRLYWSALFEMPVPWQAAVLVCSMVQVGCAVLSPPRLLGCCLGWGYPDLVQQRLVINVIMDELSEEIQTVEPRQITF